MDCSQGSIRIPMRMALLFEWALRGSFGTLPIALLDTCVSTEEMDSTVGESAQNNH